MSRHHAHAHAPAHPVPVFHVDHPHNRYQQAQPLSQANPNLPLSMLRSGSGKYRAGVVAMDVDSDASATASGSGSGSGSCSPEGQKRCFCGKSIEKSGEGERGIYCSITCARSDAFSSLCYKPEPNSSRQSVPTVASISASLSRNPSTSSAATSTSSTYEASIPEWNASHYRRLAHADLRKEERKEERRRRRAEGSFASTTTTATSRSTAISTTSSNSRVPDLVGGHSRNPSVASSVSSIWSNLSRNASIASSASSRRQGGNNVNVDTVIMEADDEEEWLTSGPNYDTHPYASKKGHKRGHSSGQSKSRKKLEGNLGMGKDMRDVLEEILQMEKVFIVDEQDPSSPSDLGIVAPYTAAFDRPPRTPSPPAAERERRKSRILMAPKVDGHRPTLSNTSPPRDVAPGKRGARPPSLVGLHQSSLSESHTALYLATASPTREEGRRSASPKLQARQSILFTPEAGPSIFNLAMPTSGGNATPSRRRMNFAPAHHPNMDAWRFPAASGFGLPSGPTVPSNTVTPTKANPQITPPGQSTRPTAAPLPTMADRVQPHLLWPPPPNLQPSLFPSSPAVETPVFTHARARAFTSPPNAGNGSSPECILPPNSGVRLGELLGSGNAEDGDVDMDTDDGSTAHGHDNGTYLPVFLEAEGFPSYTRKW